MIEKDIQRSDVHNFVVLYEIDLSNSAIALESILRFTPSLQDSKPVEWGGNKYLPYPVDAQGFSSSGTGSNARPVLTMSATAGDISIILASNNSIQGAMVRRIRTLGDYVKGGQHYDASTPISISIDEYKVDRVSEFVAGSHAMIELANPLDFENVYFPNRILSKTRCQHTYRKSLTDYNLGLVTCPYTTAVYYNNKNQVVSNIEDDNCSKTIDGCRVRYGAGNKLPILVFPAM